MLLYPPNSPVPSCRRLTAGHCFPWISLTQRPAYVYPHPVHSKHPQSCEVLSVPATTNLSPSAIVQDTPCLIRFPAAGQNNRGKGEKGRGSERDRERGRRGRKGRGEGGRRGASEKKVSSFAPFSPRPAAHFWVGEYGSQKHIPASERLFDFRGSR